MAAAVELRRRRSTPDAAAPPARACCASRSRCTRGRGRWRCSCPSWPCATSARTSWPRSTAQVVGYGGLMYVLPDAHVTTIAVDPAVPAPQASAPGCCSPWPGRPCAKGATALTLEVRASNAAAQELYRRFGFAPAGVRKGYYADTGEDALVMWAHDIDAAGLRRAPRRHRRRHPRPHDRGSSVSDDRPILGIETSCDETAAAVVVDGQHGAVVGRVAARSTSTPATAASCPRSPAGPTSSCSRRSSPRPSSRPASPDGGVDAVAATVGPGPRRLAARRRVGGQGARPRVGRALRRRQPPRGPPLRRLPRGPVARAARRRAARVGRAHAARAHGGPRPLPAARPDDRRRRRRGLRQGRPLPRPRLPGRPGHRPRSPWRATRRPSRFPRAMLDEGYDFSLLAGSRRRSSTTCASTPTSRTADVAAVVPGGGRRRARHQGPARRRPRSAPRACASAAGVAANSLLRERFLDACAEDGLHAFLPSRAMCTDNAAMVAAAGWWRLQQRRPDAPRRRRRPEPPPARSSTDRLTRRHASSHG